MIKTLQEANRSEREAFKIPRSVQQSIPIRRIYRDGIWQVGNKFSRCWRFADINYLVASEATSEICLWRTAALSTACQPVQALK